MKFIQNIQILLLILILQPFNISGQSAQKKLDRYITMLDINGRPVPEIIINVEGSNIEEYLKDQKMNFRNIAMLTSLFDYYNSLPR